MRSSGHQSCFCSYSRAQAHGKAQGHNCICGLQSSILPNLCQRAASFVMVQLVRADRTWYPPICMCRLRTTQSMHGLCHSAHVMTLLTCMQLLHVGPNICPHDSTHASATFLHTLLWRCPSTLAPLRANVCHDKHPPLLSEAVQTRNTASIATWICTLAQTLLSRCNGACTLDSLCRTCITRCFALVTRGHGPPRTVLFWKLRQDKCN